MCMYTFKNVSQQRGIGMTAFESFKTPVEALFLTQYLDKFVLVSPLF